MLISRKITNILRNREATVQLVDLCSWEASQISQIHLRTAGAWVKVTLKMEELALAHRQTLVLSMGAFTMYKIPYLTVQLM